MRRIWQLFRSRSWNRAETVNPVKATGKNNEGDFDMITGIKKAAAGFMLLVMLAAAFPGQMLTAFAATGKISFSDPSVTVGNQVSVTMKITTDGAEGLGASDVMLEYDSSALEFISGTSANGGAGSVRVLGTMESVGQSTFSFTLNFKALKAGTTNITVKSQEVYDSDSQAVTLSHVGSSAVKVSAPETYSKDASLASLTISPGELSPAFSADVTEYTATVSGDVDKVTVSAPASDSGARVVVSGNDGLQVGENEIVCKVTAEDGETVRNYTITVTKTEGTAESGGSDSTEAVSSQGSGMNVSVGDENWQVAESFDETALPEGFASSQIEYNGTQVQAGYSESDGLTLLYLTNEAGEGEFFIYNADNGTFASYVTVKMAEKTIVVLPTSEIPEDTKIPDGFEPCSIDIGDHTVSGWIWATEDDSVPEYCVVYGMNSNGEKNFYRYDQKEMTLQRYFQDPAAESTKEKLSALAEEYNSLLKDYSVRGWIIGGLFGACILLVIVLIILLLKKPGGPKKAGRSQGLDEYALTDSGNRKAQRKPAGRYRGEDGDREDPKSVRRNPEQRTADRDLDQEDDLEFVDVDEEIEDLDREFDEEESGEDSGKSVADMEKDIASSLADEAERSAKTRKTDDTDDDFEFIDLDL